MALFNFMSRSEPDSPADDTPMKPRLNFVDVLSLPQSPASVSDKNIQAFSSAALSQAVAMIGEDIQSHMKSMEQVYVAANAKALALIAVEATAPVGENLLTQIALSQTNTINFMTGAATVATALSKI